MNCKLGEFIYCTLNYDYTLQELKNIQIEIFFLEFKNSILIFSKSDTFNILFDFILKVITYYMGEKVPKSNIFFLLIILFKLTMINKKKYVL